jgi:hypothetical protein
MFISFASCLFVASSFCCALCCFKLLPCHLIVLFHCIALSLLLHCFNALFHYVASSRCCTVSLCYLFRLVTLFCSFALLPRHIVFSLRCVVFLFHMLPFYFIALLPTSPCCHHLILRSTF